MTLTHTFGGTALDRYLVEFEPTVDAGDPGAAAAVAEPAAAAAGTEAGIGAAGEPAAAAGDPATEPAAAEPGAGEEGDVDERQFWNAIRDVVAEEFQAMRGTIGAGPQPTAEPAANASGAPTGFDWSELNALEDDFGSQLGQGISHAVQQAVQEALNPFTSAIEQTQQQQQLEQGEQVLQDIIQDSVTRGDDLTDEGKQLVRPLVDVFFGRAAERYGASNPRAAEAAVEQAVEYVRSIERAAAGRGATMQQNRLATLAEAAGEPAGSGAAATVPGQPARYPSTQDLIARHATR